MMRRSAAPSSPRRLPAGASRQLVTSKKSPRVEAPRGAVGGALAAAHAELLVADDLAARRRSVLCREPPGTRSRISRPRLVSGIRRPPSASAASQGAAPALRRPLARRPALAVAGPLQRRQAADDAVHLPHGGDELGRLAGAHREHAAALGLDADALQQALHERDAVDGVEVALAVVALARAGSPRP